MQEEGYKMGNSVIWSNIAIKGFWWNHKPRGWRLSGLQMSPEPRASNIGPYYTATSYILYVIILQ